MCELGMIGVNSGTGDNSGSSTDSCGGWIRSVRGRNEIRVLGIRVEEFVNIERASSGLIWIIIAR